MEKMKLLQIVTLSIFFAIERQTDCAGGGGIVFRWWQGMKKCVFLRMKIM